MRYQVRVKGECSYGVLDGLAPGVHNVLVYFRNAITLR